MKERSSFSLPDQKGQGKSLELGRQIVVFMGPEGSGKSTIAKRLAEEIGRPRIAIGDVLREIAKNPEAEYHEACRKMFEDHAYLDPGILLDILAERFKQNDVAEGFIVDGGMRTLEEAEGLQSVLDKADKADIPLTTVYLRIPGWMSMERLVTGEGARERSDDTVDGVLSRLSNHYKNLGVRSSFIRHQENWELLQVNAMGSVDQTYSNVRKSLGAK